jgi:hypothetical protein
LKQSNAITTDLFTGAIIVLLVMLSMILTISVLFPGVSGGVIAGILIGGSVFAVVITVGVRVVARMSGATTASKALPAEGSPVQERDTWRMPPLDQLPPARLTSLERIWLIVLRIYLLVAAGLVLVRIVLLAATSA